VNLGWRFHRIWSTDWFLRKEDEIRRAMKAFEDAVFFAGKLDRIDARFQRMATLLGRRLAPSLSGICASKARRVAFRLAWQTASPFSTCLKKRAFPRW
jgi:hypothetical protein